MTYGSLHKVASDKYYASLKHLENVHSCSESIFVNKTSSDLYFTNSFFLLILLASVLINLKHFNNIFAKSWGLRKQI